MWWHHVKALSAFNVLVNYWWSTSPEYMATPMNALYHAIWTLRDRPENEKRAWKSVFDYYVFGRRRARGEHSRNTRAARSGRWTTTRRGRSARCCINKSESLKRA